MQMEAQDEHRWLLQLVGEWRYESEAVMGPDEPLMKFKGEESVRALGGLWVLLEGRGEMPGGDMATMLMTLGYDPQRGRFSGSWVGSMMTYLWVYDGSLDKDRRILSLDAEGPDFAEEGKMGKYRDVIELHSPDHRTLKSHTLGDDGQWHCFMTANYWRK